MDIEITSKNDIEQDILDDIPRMRKGKRKEKLSKGKLMQKDEKKMPTRKPATIIYWLRVFFDDYKGVYADIEARDMTTYEQLHDAIFTVFNRWEEHLYVFTLPDGTQVLSSYDEMDEDCRPANKCKLGKALSIGDTIDYLFDFGDSWEHTIDVLGFKTPEPKVKYPRIIEVHGEVPPQCPEDEDDDFEDNEPENGK